MTCDFVTLRRFNNVGVEFYYIYIYNNYYINHFLYRESRWWADEGGQLYGRCLLSQSHLSQSPPKSLTDFHILRRLKFWWVPKNEYLCWWKWETSFSGNWKRVFTFKSLNRDLTISDTRLHLSITQASLVLPFGLHEHCNMKIKLVGGWKKFRRREK